jgi:hypothetical protein
MGTPEGLALAVLTHPDVGRLVWGKWSARATHRLACTCQALRALQRARLAAWRARLRVAIAFCSARAGSVR